MCVCVCVCVCGGGGGVFYMKNYSFYILFHKYELGPKHQQLPMSCQYKDTCRISRIEGLSWVTQ